MEITQIIGFLVIIAGLIAGIVLAKIAKEELKSGKKYFIFLKKALLSAVVIIACAYSANFMLSAVVVLAFIYLFVTKFRFNLIITYALFAFIYFIISKNIILPSLMFIYGLPEGTLLKVKQK